MLLRILIPLLLLLRFPAAPAERDALAISAGIAARHLPHGTVLDPLFAGPASNRITGYTRAGDSATWTGHYLAAEAFRYRATRDPKALEQVKRALAGIRLLVDVTGTGLLARCALPRNSPYGPGIHREEAHHGVHRSRIGTKAYTWLGNTSRDQYAGVFFGLGVAFDMVDDRQVRAEASDLVSRMLDFLLSHQWFVAMPGGGFSTTFTGRVDQQLTLLQIGRHLVPGKYEGEYTKLAAWAPVVSLPVWIESWNRYRSYHKFNIDALSFYHLLKLESDPRLCAQYKKAYEVLRATTRADGNPFFDCIDKALAGPDARRDDRIEGSLEAWLRRPRRDVLVDLRGEFPECDGRACSPIPIERRIPTDFLWQRSPYQLRGNGKGLVEGAGIDYILPYWMFRVLGVRGARTRACHVGTLADAWRGLNHALPSYAM